VTVGIPLPQAAWREGDAPLLLRTAGQAVPLQMRVTDRWPDGSARWVLLDFQATVTTGDATFDLERGFGDEPSETRIDVREAATGITIDTGAAQFYLAVGGALPFEQVVIDGEAVLTPRDSRFTITDAGKRAVDVRADRVWVDERGPLRTSIGVSARAQLADAAYLNVLIRLDFFAGSNAVRCALTLRNPRRAQHSGGFWELGDRGSVLLRDVAVTLSSAAATLTDGVRCSPERGMPMQTARQVDIFQASSGGENWRSNVHVNRSGEVPLAFRGYRFCDGDNERRGQRATPVVAIGAGHRGIAVTMPQFWENFPKAVAGTPSTITLRLYPEQHGDLHELQGGEQKTHCFTIAFSRDTITDEPLEWARSPLIAHAEPAWYAATGAITGLTNPADSDPTHRELVEAAIAGPDTFERKREVIDEYGWRNYGDLYADHEDVGHSGPRRVSHYNNQYDALAGFGLQFMRTADPRWFALMDDLARHVIDIDIYHSTDDKSAYNGGLFWHTCHYTDAGMSTHRSYPRAPGVSGGGPSGEHNYTTGLMLHYFLTGNPVSRDAAIGLARWVVSMDDGDATLFRWLSRGDTGLATQAGSALYHGPGRGSGNSLNALLDGFRLTGDPLLMRKAEAIVRRCIHPADDIDARDLLDAERRWFYTVFLQAVGKFLAFKAEREEFDDLHTYARDCLLHYARWMAQHEYPYLDRPERLEYPNETWAAQDIRKSDVFAYAALHASGDERSRFVERARFFFRYAIDTLRDKPTRTLTRPVVLLLSNGLLFPALERLLERPSPHSHTRPHAGEAFPMIPFVPQKVRALQRAGLLASVAGLAGLATLVVWMLL
jgi:hypothetical protein